jgi:phospholipid-binding lipoprotein MlaA
MHLYYICLHKINLWSNILIKYSGIILLSTVIAILASAKVTFAQTENNDDYVYNYNELYDKCQVYDPYEPINRKIFFINGVLDTFILRPVTKGYDKFTNDYTKSRVSSFLGNIREPVSTVNYGIQKKPQGVFKTFWRFAINSTLGIAGIFDVAGKLGLQAEPQTFGNTLAHYGVGAGPYIVLPLYGGVGARDLMDVIVLNTATNPVMYHVNNKFSNVYTAVNVIDARNKVMPFTDYVAKNSPDQYIAIRNAILNNRESKVTYQENFICPTPKKSK